MTNSISLEDIKPAFEKPFIIYNGGETIQQIKAQNQSITISSLYEYFMSASGDDLVFFLTNDYKELNIRDNLYSPSFPVLSTITDNETLELGSSNISFHSDYRGIRYSVNVFAVDKSNKDTYLNTKSIRYMSDVFKFNIIEDSLPNIHIEPSRSFIFSTDSSEPLVEYMNDYVNLDIEFLEDKPIFLTFSQNSNNPDNVVLDGQQLTIYPDYRGSNNQYFKYDVVIDAIDNYYNLSGSFTFQISEPPPVLLLSRPNNIDNKLYDVIKIDLSNHFQSSRNILLSFTSETSNIIENNRYTNEPFTTFENNSNLVITTDYRDKENKITVFAKDLQYLDRTTQFDILVHELSAPEPITLIHEDHLSNNLINNYTCNLYNYFESGTINPDLNFSFGVPNSHPDIFNIDGSNLSISTDLQEYEKDFKAHVKATDTIHQSILKRY